jgi:hypothetical protein
MTCFSLNIHSLVPIWPSIERLIGLCKSVKANSQKRINLFFSIRNRIRNLKEKKELNDDGSPCIQFINMLHFFLVREGFACDEFKCNNRQ